MSIKRQIWKIMQMNQMLSRRTNSKQKTSKTMRIKSLKHQET